jgi:hypothetical protein
MRKILSHIKSKILMPLMAVVALLPLGSCLDPVGMLPHGEGIFKAFSWVASHVPAEIPVVGAAAQGAAVAATWIEKYHDLLQSQASCDVDSNGDGKVDKDDETIDGDCFRECHRIAPIFIPSPNRMLTLPYVQYDANGKPDANYITAGKVSPKPIGIVTFLNYSFRDALSAAAENMAGVTYGVLQDVLVLVIIITIITFFLMMALGIVNNAQFEAFKVFVRLIVLYIILRDIGDSYNNGGVKHSIFWQYIVGLVESLVDGFVYLLNNVIYKHFIPLEPGQTDMPIGSEYLLMDHAVSMLFQMDFWRFILALVVNKAGIVDAANVALAGAVGPAGVPAAVSSGMVPNPFSFAYGIVFTFLFLILIFIYVHAVVIAVSQIAYCTMGRYLLYAVAPLFLILGLHEKTRSFYSNWFSNLLGFILQPIFITIFVSLFSFVMMGLMGQLIGDGVIHTHKSRFRDMIKTMVTEAKNIAVDQVSGFRNIIVPPCAGGDCTKDPAKPNDNSVVLDTAYKKWSLCVKWNPIFRIADRVNIAWWYSIYTMPGVAVDDNPAHGALETMHDEDGTEMRDKDGNPLQDYYWDARTGQEVTLDMSIKFLFICIFIAFMIREVVDFAADVGARLASVSVNVGGLRASFIKAAKTIPKFKP